MAWLAFDEGRLLSSLPSLPAETRRTRHGSGGGPKGPPSAPPTIPPIIITPFSYHKPDPAIDPRVPPPRPPILPPSRPCMSCMA